MLDFSFKELLVVAVVALIVLRPEDIPGLMRKLGQVFGKGKAMMNEFSSAFEDEKKELDTIIDLEGKEQVAYDVNDLDELGRNDHSLKNNR